MRSVLQAIRRFGAARMNRQVIDLKLRRLILPLLLLTFTFTFAYSFLNWLLVAKTGLMPLDEDIVNSWLPGALAWILVIVLIQPRLRLLKIREQCAVSLSLRSCSDSSGAADSGARICEDGDW